ncbi:MULTISPECIES: TetR/AcrR family transcriptional regulator [Odoribacteraceae]|uniref:TetR/AcrR family transcriptional regulator n=1 Tax=Odoribacteraceae TaxID=1853231 RepID=UPI000E4E419E|nr:MULTISPECIES: TetR/AcrR family transcriptional regulator [Odoribacteraceae]MCQ4872850.1 TetR/AcrR family transcriptional regulator [Butyricimonas paravirosa]RHR78351.1 TetR/AcrR family transcriptional regulator [Odoribacter sp. AF15-53]
MSGTRDTIIETAFLLFLKKGYKAVTLTDLEKAVGMTKGTFYYHFLNKEEVLKEGVTKYYRVLNNRRAEEMGRVHSLREFIDLTIHNLEGIGHYGAKRFDSDIPEILCLSLMVEVISLYPEFKQMVSDTKISWMSKLEGVILEAKRDKEIRDDVDTSILAKNLLNIGVGLINYVVMHQDISYALSSVRYQYEQLYSLVKVN